MTTDSASPVCESKDCYGVRCEKPAGHDGIHEANNGVNRWTDNTPPTPVAAAVSETPDAGRMGFSRHHHEETPIEDEIDGPDAAVSETARLIVNVREWKRLGHTIVTINDAILLADECERLSAVAPLGEGEVERPRARVATLEALAAKNADQVAAYHELLYNVGNKYDGETRHETAMRYLRQAEQRECEPAKAVTQDTEN